MENLNLLLKLRIAEVNTLGADVFVSKHATQNVTFHIQILDRNNAGFVWAAGEMANQNQSRAVLDLKNWTQSQSVMGKYKLLDRLFLLIWKIYQARFLRFVFQSVAETREVDFC